MNPDRSGIDADGPLPVLRCPKCGGNRLHWTLHRVASVAHGSDRFLAWLCRGCGAEWFEPIVFGIEPIIEEPPPSVEDPAAPP